MQNENIILAGDVGGTKTLLALFERKEGKLIELQSKRYVSNDFKNLDVIIKDFVEEQDIFPHAAAFGIPGPVLNGVVKSTNLPWIIDEKKLRIKTGIPLVKVVNDLAATAYEIPFLEKEKVITIKEGIKLKDPERFVILAPGTGLGHAFLICEGNKKIVVPSEGGHADFAPTNEFETKLFRFLLNRFGRVSCERIISGSGIPNIFDFLVEIEFGEPENHTLERMKTEDKSAVISEMALNKKDRVCEKTLDIFVTILGTHAGNLAITFLANGGIYLAGGIPHKILPKLKDGTFTKSFNNKGRLSEIVNNIPVYVINNNYSALHGAARLAFNVMEDLFNKT
jgi:glucokinase